MGQVWAASARVLACFTSPQDDVILLRGLSAASRQSIRWDQVDLLLVVSEPRRHMQRNIVGRVARIDDFFRCGNTCLLTGARCVCATRKVKIGAADKLYAVALGLPACKYRLVVAEHLRLGGALLLIGHSQLLQFGRFDAVVACRLVQRCEVVRIVPVSTRLLALIQQHDGDRLLGVQE